MSAVRPPIAPMLARLVRALPDGDHFFEPKWDGFRALVFRDGETVDIRSRNDRRLARYFPELVEAIRAVPRDRFVLDGEIVVVGMHGLDFAALMSRLHPAASRVAKLRNETPAAFIAFDVLAIGDDDLRDRRFDERRTELEALLAHASSRIVPTPSTRNRTLAEEWLEHFVGGGVDGVVAKDPSLHYEPNRRAMIKVKRARTADCVIAGMRLASDGARPIVASMLLGLYDEHDRLVHFGVVSQLTDERRSSLVKELAPRMVPLAGHPWEHGFGLERSPLGRLSGSAGRWTEGMELDWVPLAPTRVCEVAYDVVDDRRLRYPARFVRFRDDRDAQSCRFDQLSNDAPDLIAYALAIAPVILPHLADRPITIGRFPSGVMGPGFAQAEVPARPEWIRSAPLRLANGDVKAYTLIDHRAALVWLAQMGTLELHPFLGRFRGGMLGEPAAVMFDLDPGPPAGLREAADVALLLRERLERHNLRAFAKTSGSLGMHVVVPVRGATYLATRAFAEHMTRELIALRPDRVIATMARDARAGKVLVDVRQNAERLSTVAPYSLRATPRPWVSTPVTWDEVARGDLVFDAPRVLTRAHRADPFAPTLHLHQALPAH